MKRKTFSVMLALVLVLSFGLVTAVPVMAGTLNVPSVSYPTIQSAVTASSPGDTINVAAGTYSTATNGESFPITIDKSLTLKGAQFGTDPTVSEARTEESAESVIDATGAMGSAIEIGVNNVILDGFTVKNVPSVNVPGDVRYGIKVLPQSGDHSTYSSDITIQNNILTDNNRGIYLLDNENSLVKQNLIVNCESTTIGVYSGGSGIVLSYVKPTTQVTQNVLSGNVAKGSYYGPILVAYGRQYTQPTITNNLIANNYTEGTPSWGIVVVDASAIIRDNTITGNQGGGIWTLWGTAETPTILIEGNEITGNALSGIEISTGTFAVNITGNTISENGGAGINVQSGITTDVTVHYNNIFGNGDGVLSPTVAIDATYNWWGDASGPGGVGPGSGDSVSASVDYDPWVTGLTYTGATLFSSTQTVVLQATLSDSTTGGPSGAEVKFYVDGTPVGSSTTNGDGVATLAIGTKSVGVYAVRAVALDPCLEAEALVVVYDPSAGFVTGGGWIMSPAGAYTPNTNLTGKATFGFVSKYKKGADTPTGQTEFVFKAADLNFHSSSYDWLVVTGSDYAKFKGSGTINGMGDYKFMLWAGDSDPDTFRIKIWTEENNVETVIYDNGMNQAIEGGNIVVHKSKK